MHAHAALRRNLVALIAFFVLATAGPALAKSREKLLTETLRTYAATIRWGTIEQAESFVDPAYRAEHPLTDLELARYRQVRFTAYNDRAPVAIDDFEVHQTVEIGLINVNTQEARSVIDRQVWKFDRTAKAWTLHSGLPDITRRD